MRMEMEMEMKMEIAWKVCQVYKKQNKFWKQSISYKMKVTHVYAYTFI